MLKVKFSKIIEYAGQNEPMMRKADKEFFGNLKIDAHMEDIDAVLGLFNEWLIFDFKMSSGITVIADYYFKNPNLLTSELLDELKQIIETQHFEIFEIQSIKRGHWLRIYGLYTGNKYTVYEHSGSLSAPSRGTFWGRVAKINGKHILVGSNPMFLPTVSTPRLKKMYLENKPDHLSPKDILPLVLPQKTKPSEIEKEQMTSEELEKKREYLKKQYVKLQGEKSFSVSFKNIVSFINNENYQKNFADFFTDLIKLGIPEEIVFHQATLLNDIWNFFPHKKLNGKSPYEMYKKHYG